MGIRLSILTVEDPCCVAWLGRGVGYMRTLRHLGPLFLTLHRPPVARHAAVALPGDKGVAPDLFGDDRDRTGKIGRAVL